MFRATRSTAGSRQIITILTTSSVFRAPGQPPTRSALLTPNWRGCEGTSYARTATAGHFGSASTPPIKSLVSLQRRGAFECRPLRARAASAAHGRVSDRKIAARCPDVPRDPVNCRQSPDYHNLNNKFRLQSARSTTNEKRAADPKLARLRRHFVPNSLKGDLDAARSAVAELMKLRPEINSVASWRAENLFYTDPRFTALAEKTLYAGLHRAGFLDE